MKIKEDYCFEISISEKAYKMKPERADYERMKFCRIEVNPGIMLDYIRAGYSYCHVYKNNHRSKDDFLYTNIVSIDVDDCVVSMTDFLKKPVMKPTIAYTTFSNNQNGLYSYRLIYCFSERINAQTFAPLYRSICAYTGLMYTKDNCGKVLSQLMNGNSLPDMQWYLSNRIYEVSDFLQSNHLELYCNDDRIYNSKKPNCIIQEDISNEHVDMDIIVCDLNKLKPQAFLSKYAYLGIVDQTPLEYNEYGYCLIPDTFLKVFDRIVWSNNHAHINKYKDGENRRKRLYVDACIIRKIEPEISFAKLLYNLVYRRHWYYDNGDGTLKNNILVEKAKYVLSLPITDLDEIKPTKHGKFTTSKDYCQKNGLKRSSYARTVMKTLNHQSIGEWYDLSMSVAENLKYAMENGIKVSRSTLKTFCKEQGIDTNPQRKPIQSWYNPDLSVKENMERAAQLGIKVSVSNLYNYCKAKGLSPKGKK